MSTLIIDFPDCARLGSREDRVDEAKQDDTITVFTESCPVAPPGPPPVIGAGEIVGAVLMFLALIVGVVVVRYKAHEQRPAKLAAANEARKIELDGEIRKIEASRRQSCDMCGSVYEPAVEDK